MFLFILKKEEKEIAKEIFSFKGENVFLSGNYILEKDESRIKGRPTCISKT